MYFIKVIYDGAHSIVNKIGHDDHVYALKSIECDHYGLPDIALREITLLKKLNHQHIIKLHDVMIHDQYISLLLDYCDCDLKFYIYHNNVVFNNILSFFHQICLGVNYLHENNIMHRDLKPENILLYHNNIIKICDFGLSIYTSSQINYSYNVVTLYYRAPEVLLKLKYGKSIDIWSLGCILVEMLTQQILYKGNYVKEMLSLIDQINLHQLSIENDILQLILQLLTIKDNERITIQNVLTYI